MTYLIGPRKINPRFRWVYRAAWHHTHYAGSIACFSTTICVCVWVHTCVCCMFLCVYAYLQAKFVSPTAHRIHIVSMAFVCQTVWSFATGGKRCNMTAGKSCIVNLKHIWNCQTGKTSKNLPSRYAVNPRHKQSSLIARWLLEAEITEMMFKFWFLLFFSCSMKRKFWGFLVISFEYAHCY